MRRSPCRNRCCLKRRTSKARRSSRRRPRRQESPGHQLQPPCPSLRRQPTRQSEAQAPAPPRRQASQQQTTQPLRCPRPRTVNALRPAPRPGNLPAASQHLDGSSAQDSRLKNLKCTSMQASARGQSLRRAKSPPPRENSTKASPRPPNSAYSPSPSPRTTPPRPTPLRRPAPERAKRCSAAGVGVATPLATGPPP